MDAHTFGFKLTSDEIGGYTYNTENFCRSCILSVCIPQHLSEPQFLTRDAEVGLNNYAEYLGIERTNEHTFDSSEFPKTILVDLLEDDDICGNCSELIIDCD